MTKPKFALSAAHPAATAIKVADRPAVIDAPNLDEPIRQCCQTCKARDTNGDEWVAQPMIKIEPTFLRFNSKAFHQFGLLPKMVFAIGIQKDERFILIQQIRREFRAPQEVYKSGFYTMYDARTTSRPHKYEGPESWAGYLTQSHCLTIVDLIPTLAGRYYPLEQHPDKPDLLFADVRKSIRYESVRAQKHLAWRDLMKHVEDFDGL